MDDGLIFDTGIVRATEVVFFVVFQTFKTVAAINHYKIPYLDKNNHFSPEQEQKDGQQEKGYQCDNQINDCQSCRF